MEAPQNVTRRKGKRRLFAAALGVAAALALAIAIGVHLHKRRRQRLYSEPLHVTGHRAREREIDADTYRLRVTGLVENELSLTLDQVVAVPSQVTDVPLECVLNWKDHAYWRGAAIRDVIAGAKPKPEGRWLVFRDNDKFSASLDMDYVQNGKPLLAWEVNGEPLPREQGWPLRVVAPGKWGYKWVKWVHEIEVTDRAGQGTYEGRGYSQSGSTNEPKREEDKRE